MDGSDHVEHAGLPRWERAAMFLIGCAVLVLAAADECSRVSQVVIGLLLMGILSWEQIWRALKQPGD